MTDGTPSQPPGWYHAAGDPVGTQRYWDGELWQGDPVAPPSAQVAYAAARRTNHNYADWGTRVGASLVDALIFGGVLAVVILLSLGLANVSEPLGILVGLGLGVPLFVATLYLL